MRGDRVMNSAYEIKMHIEESCKVRHARCPNPNPKPKPMPKPKPNPNQVRRPAAFQREMSQITQERRTLAPALT